MSREYEREERMEKGNRVNENTSMKANRGSGRVGEDSAESIQRAGGHDPRRYDAKIMIDRTVQDHSVSGYNHNGVQVPEAASGNNRFKAEMERKVSQMGTPMPDGTYRR